MTNAILRGKPDAGNPHVRFDEGEVASAKPRRGSLLYKKLICAAVVAGSMFAMAEEAPKAAVKAPVAAEAVKAAPRRSQITPEQREKLMAERKAKTEVQMLEVVKKYIPEEEKAKALVKELQETMKANRRNMMMRRPTRPGAKKPAERK